MPSTQFTLAALLATAALTTAAPVDNSAAQPAIPSVSVATTTAPVAIEESNAIPTDITAPAQEQEKRTIFDCETEGDCSGAQCSIM